MPHGQQAATAGAGAQPTLKYASQTSAQKSLCIVTTCCLLRQISCAQGVFELVCRVQCWQLRNPVVQTAASPIESVAATAKATALAMKGACKSGGLSDAWFVAKVLVEECFRGKSRQREDGTRKSGGRRDARPSEHRMQLTRGAYDERVAYARYVRQQRQLRAMVDAGRILTYDHCYKYESAVQLTFCRIWPPALGSSGAFALAHACLALVTNDPPAWIWVPSRKLVEVAISGLHHAGPRKIGVRRR